MEKNKQGRNYKVLIRNESNYYIVWSISIKNVYCHDYYSLFVKSGLEVELISNYRRVLHLSYLSKLVEKVIASQHLTESSTIEKFWYENYSFTCFYCFLMLILITVREHYLLYLIYFLKRMFQNYRKFFRNIFPRLYLHRGVLIDQDTTV